MQFASLPQRLIPNLSSTLVVPGARFADVFWFDAVAFFDGVGIFDSDFVGRKKK